MDTKVKSNAEAIQTNKSNISTNTNAIAAETTARTTADTELSNKIGTLDTQVKTNANAIGTNTTNISANKTSIDELKTATTTNLATKAYVNASNLTSLLDKDLTAWGTALGKGTIAAGSNQLITGKTIYDELTPTGTVYYIGSAMTTAARLTTLDNTLKTFADQLGMDLSNNTNLANQLYKYFKVNPKATTDGTTTYDPDAAANGTHSVAIGPSAQAGEKTTDTTTSATTVTGGTSSTAIGDSAKANGDQSVALGYGSQVLNTTDQSGKTTATISGSTAIGNGAKVNGATDATAIGTSAQVNETATGGIAFGKNAVTGEDKGTVTVGDVTANVAAVGGENSVALGTSAKASGNTALALGNGAQVNNYTTQSGTTVSKKVNSGSTAIGSGAIVTGADDAVALGTNATVTGTGDDADDSIAIGKSASVATAKDAMALGTSASVARGADNAIAIGNMAKANTSNTTAIGYNASATGAGAVAIGNTSTSTGGGISIGSGTSVSGKSIAIGYSADAITTGSANTNAIAIGNGAQANSNDSVSIGNQAGKGTSQGRNSGYGSLIAIGTNAGNNVTGMQNVALGSGAGSNVKSSYNVAIGSNAGAGIAYAAATDSNPQNGYNVSIGYEANYQSADANAKNIAESIAIGHSANAVSNATAMGYQTTASGDKSMAFGYNATAADMDSIAFGDNASAGGGNIAIGHGSQAPAVTSYSSSYLTNNTTLNGYISLGGKTTATSNDRILRRITNVADGSDDQDAVTVAQLKAAYTNLEGTIKTTDTKISDTYTQEAIDTKIKNVESKITASKTKYFSINTSSDTLTANADSNGASTSGAADAMAIGPNASASSSKAVAIGNNVSASGKGSIALGTADNPAMTGTVDVGQNTSANPHVTSAEGANSVAIGTSAIAQTDNSVALGTRASVYTSDVTDKNTGTTTRVGQQSIAIGYQAETRNSNATSIGSGAKAYSNGSTAIGHSAYAQGADSAVIGTSSTANGASAGILGKSNTVNGSNTYAVGSENKVNGSNTYAVGSENEVNGNWGAVTYSGLYGSKNKVNPVADTLGNTKHGMDSLSVTGNSNTISQGSYSDTVQNISILGNGNSVTGANTDEANAGTTANITIIGGDNKVSGRDGAGSDDMGKTWKQLIRTTVIGYGNTVNQATATTSLADTQILGNDVTATLGNSVYLGTGAVAKNANVADSTTLTNAETAAVDALDTTGMTDTEKATAQAKAKEKARYATNLAAMKKSGTTAGLQTLNADTTYDDGTSYTYAGSSPAGVVTVGSVGAERRIQNVAAGLVSATSTDAVNGSQLYALTRQIRFGGDNSSFGTTTADDKNVVARGSNETIAITGGSDAVTASTADGTTTYTVDAAKLTGNNIAVVADADKNALHVQLASNLKNLNTAQLGSGSGGSYKETIKLDGIGNSGGSISLSDATGILKNTMDTTGMSLTSGAKFTSSGISAGSQQINNVTAGTSDTDAVNYGQLKNARTLLTEGANTTLSDTVNGDQHTYAVNVDNLAVKANGTGTTVALANGINFKNGSNTTSAVDNNGNVTIDTKNLTLKANGTNQASVSMDGGINFKDGTNTTATVGTDGMVTISATHNKLDSASYTASKPSDSSNQTTVKLKDTDGNETTLNLTDTYTTVSKNTDHTISFKRNDGSNPVSISLDDLNGASNEALTKAAAKATTTVIKGTNVDSVDDDTTSADGHHIYKVNVSNLGVKVADGQKKSVALSDGLVFGNGTNTTASVGQNGAITFNVSNDAIKTQAKDAINMTAGTNVNVDTETSPDSLSKTFTISATHNALKSATITSKSNDVSTLTITGNDGDTASVDIKNTHLTVTKDSKAKTVTFTSNDGTTPATTLSLSDLGAASTADMNAAKAAASTEVKAGTNASLGTVETNQTDQHKIYTVNVDNLGLKQNGTAAGTVMLADGINFADGTNTSATVSDGKVMFDLKKDITNIDTITASNSIQAGNVKVGKQGTDNKNYVTGLENKNWTVGQTTYEAGRAATEDQLKSVSDKVASGFQVTDGTTSANIGADKKVTFTNGNYTTAKVTQATDGANVQYDINTAQINAGVNGTITAPTTDGVATAANVAEAINSAAWNIKANDGTATAIKAGTTVGLKAGNNLTLSQSGTDFTYRLNDELTGIKRLTTVAQDGVTTTLAASGVTIASSGTGNKSVSLTANGLNNGGKQITDVASGGDTDTNAANISDVKRLVQASASGTTETGFNVKGDDATAKKVKLGKQLNVVGGTNDTSKLSDGNIGVVTTDDGQGNATLTVKLNKNINLDSVKAGNTTLDTNGLTISGGPKIVASGIDAGNRVISGVANGSNDTDAVNVSQLKAIQSDVDAGWTLKGKDSTNVDVNANIGKGKSVTYNNGSYTKSVVTKDGSGNATVKVDVTTGTLTAGTDGKITSSDGLATTGDVANAVNSTSWTIQDGNHTKNAQQVKAGDTVSFKAGDNLSLEQNGKEFTYKLNKTLTDMDSVTTVDDKQNTSVLNGEGLKVSDKDGNSLTQHATEIRIHDSNAKADDTTTDVVLKKDGLHNGGHTITGVADGQLSADSKEAVNGSQLYALQQKVTNGGWDIIGDNENKSTHIGNDKTVSFKSGKNSTVSVTGTDTGAEVKVDVNTAQISTNDAHQATATGTGLADASEVVNAINSAAWNVQKKDGAVQQVKAGDTVTFAAGDNMVLTQSGTSFTYGLAPDVNTNSIRLGGTQGTNGSWTGGIYIGKQIGGGANLNEGDYITGLDNTAWDLSKVVENRAATEGQLKAAINQVTIASQSGGFGLRDEKGSTVSQMLGQTVGIIGDTEYEADGKTVKQKGNITTEADSTNAGAVKVKLNKDLDLTEQGSVTIGTTSLTSGQAKVGNVTVNGNDNTVSGLANTTWDEATAKRDGYKGSTKAATESQLQAVYDQATTTASANEQHIQAGTYDIVTQSDANGKKQNSVTMNIVDGSGNTKGQVVINDVAKASDLGDTTKLDSDIQNKNGSTSVVDAVNNLNDKVGDNKYLAVTGKEIQNGDSSTTAIGKLNNRMNDIYSKATQHSTVTKADDNVTIQTSTNADGGTNYQIGLNKDEIHLGNVTIQGNEGSITAKSMTADTFTAGNTVVSNDGVKVGDKSALTGDSLKVGGKTYVDDKGIDANGQAIRNVGDGKNDGDAVNVKQVNDLAARQGEAIGQNAAHINQLDRAVNRLDSRINRVGARAAALAALHPGNYDPDDKVDFAAGFGNYRGASAAAVGMYYHPDETTTMSVGASFGGGENMVNAGITWKMGKDSGHMRTQAAQKAVPVQFVTAPTQPNQPTEQVKGAKASQPVTAVTTTASGQQVPIVAAYLPSVDNSTRAENDELKELLARQTAILEKLADQKTAPAQAAAPVSGEDLFPDVPENHWAYDFVAKLAQAGALKDCRVEDPANNPMLTRNDFAQILYTALKNGATKNPALNKDGGLNHLANEFRAELKNVKR